VIEVRKRVGETRELRGSAAKMAEPEEIAKVFLEETKVTPVVNRSELLRGDNHE
jgi:hypothetical protein